ncbi:DUF3099 domain-containing protein [Nesterenkonia sp. NBAIMH1]|uniref:DUF3099 domain-containing protein n=1 Tax=Nesterenkonia sp. NBAIMH1 TaxID=2600320 RepID=UPI00143D9537|nr:DUF3099 domain-containing protein [Nesterenkonia sp. NBAIMH1]
MSEPVYSVTDAPMRHSVEQRSRMVAYTVQMSLRMVCFLLAGLTAVVWQSWWAAVFVVAAIILPYTAVVGATASGDRYLGAAREGVDPQRQLTAEHEEPEDEPRQWWEEQPEEPVGVQSGDTVIEGEIVSGEVERGEP